MDTPLQPLRIPAGWVIDWNTLFERDPTPGNVADGYFGGSGLFLATHRQRRFLLEVQWRPEDDPDGRFLVIVCYAPWKRAPEGRRISDDRLEFDRQDPVHRFETRSREELVREVEHWLLRCAGWVREGS